MDAKGMNKFLTKVMGKRRASQMGEEMKRDLEKEKYGGETKQKYDISKTPYQKARTNGDSGAYYTKLVPKRQEAIHLKDIKEEVERIIKELRQKHPRAQLCVTTRTPIGVRSGEYTDVGNMDIGNAFYNPRRHYNMDEYEAEHGHYATDLVTEDDFMTDFFEIMVYAPKEAGKTTKDQHNDCLFYALLKSVGGDYNDLPSQVCHPERMKKNLGVERDEGVSYELLGQIEDWMKCRIDLYGDIEVVSQKKYQKGIKLTLKNEHYSLRKEGRNSPFRARGVSFKERKIITYYNPKNSPKIICFNGEEQKEMDFSEMKEMRNKPMTSPFIFIVVKKLEELQSYWKEYVQACEELKELSHCKINLFKANSIPNEAIKLWLEFNTMIAGNEPEEIDEHEMRFILGCRCGFLAFAEKYEGVGYEADVNSYYAKLMSSSSSFPIKKGTFETISDEEFAEMKYFKFGIYQTKIEKSDDENINKLFDFNEKNYYTFISMTRAKELGLKMQMIQHNAPNFLFYPPEARIRYDHAFKNYMQYLFTLKRITKQSPELISPLARDILKKLITTIWGRLCEKKRRKATISKDNLLDSDLDIKLIRSTRISDEEDHLEYYVKNDTFSTPYCRIGVFLTDLGRTTMSKTIQPFIGDVVRCICDCFICKKPIEGLPVSEKMGEFKIKQGMVKVIRANKVEWL